ncbi:XTP/dITP diphosphatase [Candidatus Thorarchaeota archaeon]|nr:MAG: XTP/dITP diphosphatase [Candidatus Thorarchaeota archaeon]
MSNSRILLVTQNEHKLRELTPLFNNYGVDFETSPLEKREVRSNSIEVVAREAAKYAFAEVERPLVLDDTGLFIDSLNGFPMAYPAFVLETIGVNGILKLMKGETKRSARFVTAVGFADSDAVEVFTGEMIGEISLEEAGSGGFGYDPIFIPQGNERTYAELSFSEKIAISHRTRAFTQFLEWYKERV